MAITNYDGVEMTKEPGQGVIGEYPDVQIDSKANGNGAVLDFGVPVQLVSGSENQVELFDGTGTVYGISVARKLGNDDYEAAGYDQYKPVGVLRKGSIWVKVAEDVVAGQAAVINDGTGEFLPADTSVTPVTSFTSQFKTSASATGLALLEIMLPA